MLNDLLIPITFFLAFVLGVRIRLVDIKKFQWRVDTLLILQAITIILFIQRSFIKSYFIPFHVLALALAIIFTTSNNKKRIVDRILIATILLPSFITAWARMEHWWWASYASLCIPIALVIFFIILFKYPQKIKKELPFLVYFVFDMLVSDGFWVMRQM